MVIRHNMSAMYADRTLNVSEFNIDRNVEKLASGMRINRAGDDAAGLSVSEKMRQQIRGLNRATANAEDGISFIQLTEGYLQKTQDVIHRIRELAVESANGIYTEEDRQNIQVEVSQMVDEINRIAESAQYNGMNILTGRFAADPNTGNAMFGSMWFQLGANPNQHLQIFIGTMTAAGLGLSSLDGSVAIEVTTPNDANEALGNLDNALNYISKTRADFGAYQNRMEKLVEGIDFAAENLQSAESQIRDTDMAKSMMDLTRDAILNSANAAVLAHANQNPAAILRLLS